MAKMIIGFGPTTVRYADGSVVITAPENSGPFGVDEDALMADLRAKEASRRARLADEAKVRLASQGWVFP